MCPSWLLQLSVSAVLCCAAEVKACWQIDNEWRLRREDKGVRVFEH